MTLIFSVGYDRVWWKGKSLINSPVLGKSLFLAIFPTNCRWKVSHAALFSYPKVFQALHNRDQSQLVLEWVMLSLGNVIQRTPLSTAVWCLTCLFACASSNHWINSLYPLFRNNDLPGDILKENLPRSWFWFEIAFVLFRCYGNHEFC